MTEIHILSPGPLGPDHIARLSADLTHALETGTDLGSRAPHIRAGGDRLQALVQALELSAQPLLQGLAHEEGQDEAIALRTLINTAAALARSAQGFPLTQ